jgi:hypothetical protein
LSFQEPAKSKRFDVNDFKGLQVWKRNGIASLAKLSLRFAAKSIDLLATRATFERGAREVRRRSEPAVARSIASSTSPTERPYPSSREALATKRSRAAGRRRFARGSRFRSRSGAPKTLQKKTPKGLLSLDAKLKSQRPRRWREAP